jgi:trans-aconitate 2-methyltransferase
VTSTVRDQPRDVLESDEEFRARLRAAYPPRDYGVVLPFRRVFVVAKVGGAA